MEPNKIYILHDIGKTKLTPDQAKELLTEELPAGMRKIIEEGERMSRIDEIKARLKPGSVIPYDSAFDLANTFHSDAEYLLSRLEIAEEALEKVFKNAYLDVKGEDAELMLMMSGNISEEALQQLRQ